MDRGIFDLTTRLVDTVRSAELGIQLVRIIDSLRKAMRSVFVERVETFGVRRAGEVVELALGWGSSVAGAWVLDRGFAWYLVFQNVYSR